MAVKSTRSAESHPPAASRRVACAKTMAALVLSAWLLIGCNSAEAEARRTADATALAAQQTIDAALSPPATVTEPLSTPTPDATATQRAAEGTTAALVAATATEQARLDAGARATAAALATTQSAQATAAGRATRTARANATATHRAMDDLVATIVAATATEQARITANERATEAAQIAATATKQARIIANERATEAVQATQIAAVATEKARIIASERATEAALAATQIARIAATATEEARIIASELATEVALAAIQATEIAAAATDQAQQSPDLGAQLRARLGQARVVNRYPERADRLIDALVSRLDEFVAPGYGVSRDAMIAALLAPAAEDRLNALVDNVWFEWEEDALRLGLDAYGSDPDPPNISPLRKLVIRLMQGTQGRISEQQAYAFYNFLTRTEEDHVWFDYIQGVIGAVNREVFNWSSP